MLKLKKEYNISIKKLVSDKQNQGSFLFKKNFNISKIQINKKSKYVKKIAFQQPFNFLILFSYKRLYKEFKDKKISSNVEGVKKRNTEPSFSKRSLKLNKFVFGQMRIKNEVKNF